MASGILRVRPGLNAPRSSSGSHQHKRLSDVFKWDKMTPPGTLVDIHPSGEEVVDFFVEIYVLRASNSTRLGERWEWKCFRKTKAEVDVTGCW